MRRETDDQAPSGPGALHMMDPVMALHTVEARTMADLAAHGRGAIGTERGRSVGLT